jgi:hypothetical protein
LLDPKIGSGKSQGLLACNQQQVIVTPSVTSQIVELKSRMVKICILNYFKASFMYLHVWVGQL